MPSNCSFATPMTKSRAVECDPRPDRAVIAPPKRRSHKRKLSTPPDRRFCLSSSALPIAARAPRSREHLKVIAGAQFALTRSVSFRAPMEGRGEITTRPDITVLASR